MATGSVCQQLPSGELSHEMGEEDQASAEAAALHERLVAYVHALAGGHEQRSGVWVEHSYARARGAPHAPAAHVRVLLAPCPPAERADVDVERLEPPPPDLPGLDPPPYELEHDDSDVEHAGDWEARVTALAPSAVHARLAEQALDTLRRMRLERLAGGDAHLAARTAARRLRLALAGAAAHPGAHAQRPAAWLHATLHAYMPAHVRQQYDALVSSLARAAPRLAARLTGSVGPAARRSPLARVGRALGAETRPWLAWVGCGRARLDARWARRLGALLHTRVLAAATAASAAPDKWCAAVAGSVRAALADMLAEAG
ncbi:hypothetical protein PYW08_012067 [Mythimna loreyi]|uniref:Uncharacterized protein n=1 Tax=Mythimna loreyi TaxID=667449 RepID=A0ACC2QMA2_9NEOP|nr:hypothetical protein PYW08_012067 [Mythimna loreyi]